MNEMNITTDQETLLQAIRLWLQSQNEQKGKLVEKGDA